VAKYCRPFNVPPIAQLLSVFTLAAAFATYIPAGSSSPSRSFNMGMRVGGSSATSGAQSSSVAGAQQRQQSFKSLVTALQSGNLTAATTAYASLQNSGGVTQASSSSPIAQIGQALQSGDLAGAQKALQSLLGHGAGTSAAASEPADGSTIDTKA
jgi:hypothetical protein